MIDAFFIENDKRLRLTHFLILRQQQRLRNHQQHLRL